MQGFLGARAQAQKDRNDGQTACTVNRGQKVACVCASEDLQVFSINLAEL